jgi:hypothetical protein
LQVVKVHRYQRHLWQIFPWYHPHLWQILPQAPLVLLIPVAKNKNNITLLAPESELEGKK